MQYQKTQVPARTSNGRQFQGNNNNNNNFLPVVGEILSATDTNMTIKLADGSTKIVLLSTSPIIYTTPGSKTDLKVGSKIMVIGTGGNDGSITATSIQLNPLERVMRPNISP